MYNTVSARQIQREYKKIFEKANRIKKPIVVISSNKPQGAVIGLELLEQLRLNEAALEALKEYREGKTKSISAPEALEAEFEEIRKLANAE